MAAGRSGAGDAGRRPGENYPGLPRPGGSIHRHVGFQLPLNWWVWIDGVAVQWFGVVSGFPVSPRIGLWKQQGMVYKSFYHQLVALEPGGLVVAGNRFLIYPQEPEVQVPKPPIQTTN